MAFPVQRSSGLFEILIIINAGFSKWAQILSGVNKLTGAFFRHTGQPSHVLSMAERFRASCFKYFYFTLLILYVSAQNFKT